MLLRTKTLLLTLPIFIPLLFYMLLEYHKHLEQQADNIRHVGSLATQHAASELNDFLWNSQASFLLSVRQRAGADDVPALDVESLHRVIEGSLSNSSQFSLLALADLKGEVRNAFATPVYSNRFILPREIKGCQLLSPVQCRELEERFCRWKEKQPLRKALIAGLQRKLREVEKKGAFNSARYRAILLRITELQSLVHTPPHSVFFGASEIAQKAGLPFRDDSFLFVTPLLNGQQGPIGYFAALLDWTQVEDRLFDVRSTLESRGINHAEVLFFHGPQKGQVNPAPRTESLKSAEAMADRLLKVTSEAAFFSTEDDGFFARVPVADNQILQSLEEPPSEDDTRLPRERYLAMIDDAARFGLLTYIPQREFDAPAQSLVVELGLSTLVSALLLFFFILYFSHRTVTPITRLTDTMRHLGKGDGFLRLDSDRRDEIGYLLRTFNEMNTALSARSKELQQAKEEAEAANKAKSVFLANMSHELRTPLNAVLGFSQLMQNNRELTSEQRESLEIISRSGVHLLHLINNVLDISKIEAGRVELEESPVELRQFVQEIKSVMYARAVEKGLDFSLEESADLPGRIKADAGKLRQVLLNLIGNAVKYTKSGGVILRISVTAGESAEQVRLRFEVEDSGPGIRQEDRERIFSPFVQLGERPPVEAGAGLGLAICNQFVALMGGEIGVTEAPGRGSLFWFSIPVSVPPSGQESAEPVHGRVIGLAEGGPRYRLLIAEDQPENRLLLRRLLDPLGFIVREATNGAETIEVFKQWRPDLIFMDIRMPVMDGLEATRRIKALDKKAETRIVAVTAHAFEEERRQIMAAGCDGFIRKPFDQADIFEALAGYLGVQFLYQDQTGSAAPTPRLDEVDPADLPEGLRSELEQALCRIDLEAVRRAIEAIRQHNPALADKFAAEARELQFGRLLRIVRAARHEEERDQVTGGG